MAADSNYSITIKVAWLKQKVDEDKKQPLLEFDEQQSYTFDSRSTSFRMVKHSCSYPAPPHKVRMWCSSLGASTELPSTMDLNLFINTFELITEERHSLEMAHLCGGETIAFEMLQGEQVSELSTFILGTSVKAVSAAAKIQSKRPAVNIPSLPAQKAAGAAPSTAPVVPLRTSQSSVEERQRLRELRSGEAKERERLAMELIAEEEEEARKREREKEKKKAKKQKQKAKKNAKPDDKDDEDEDDKGDELDAAGKLESVLFSQRKDPAASPSKAPPTTTNLLTGSTHSTDAAGKSSTISPVMHSPCVSPLHASALQQLYFEGEESFLSMSTDPDAAGISALQTQLEQMRIQVVKSRDVIRALVLRCLEERKAKEAAFQQVEQLQRKLMELDCAKGSRSTNHEGSEPIK